MKLPIKVNAIIYRINDGKKEFLILKRCEQDGSFWQTLTGTVDDIKESLQNCLIREIEEEAGLAKNILNISDLIYTFTWLKDKKLINEFVLKVLVAKNSRVTLSKEHVDYKWCLLPKAIDLVEKTNNKKALKSFN